MSFTGQIKAIFFLSAGQLANDQLFNEFGPASDPDGNSVLAIRDRALKGKISLLEKSILWDFIERYGSNHHPK